MCALYTQFFYNGAYLLEKQNGIPRNARSQWYIRNRKSLMYYQAILGLVLVIRTLMLWKQFSRPLTVQEAIVLLALILLALSYYGINIQQKRISLRNLGWNKPFIIGFLWTAMCVWLPELISHLQHNTTFHYTTTFWLIILNNFIFISLLAIIFDVKDYADDKNERVNTFIVQYGLKGATRRILLPLTLVGMSTLIILSNHLQLSALSTFYQLLPYFGIMILTQLLQKNRSIYFYLLLVDGLIILKGALGILALQ